MISLLVLFIAELLKFAVAWNSQRQTELGAPGFDFSHEDMHFTGVELRRVARLPGGGLLTGDEVGISHLFAAEIGLFEVALNPLWGSVSAPGFNQVFTDFSQPHMKK